MYTLSSTSWPRRRHRAVVFTRPFSRRLAIGIALGYGIVCAGLYAAQRYLVFEPDTILHSAPIDYAFPVYDVSVVARDDPQRALHGWWIPASNPRATVVLYLHGNDGNVSTHMSNVTPLRELGYSVFMIDYRGYGASTGGFPSERGVYDDAQSGWDYLVRERGVSPANLIIYGRSLGGAIGIELALRHPEARGLIVESSFTSIHGLSERDARYALFPVGPFLNQRFDSIAKVGRLKLPVLYIHGTADTIVPIAMGRALYDATPSARGFIQVHAAGHDDVAALGGAKLSGAIAQFVEDAATLGQPGTDPRLTPDSAPFSN